MSIGVATAKGRIKNKAVTTQRLGRAERAWLPPGGASRLPDSFSCRGVAVGERIDLRSGSKLVRDAMREAGVPVRLRSAWPIVAVGGKIAWVAGARVAGWARLESAGEPAIELSMEGTGV